MRTATIFMLMLSGCDAFHLAVNPALTSSRHSSLRQRSIHLNEQRETDDLPTPASFSFESGKRVDGNNDLNARTMAADLKEGVAALPPVAYVIGGVGFLGFIYLVAGLLFG